MKPAVLLVSRLCDRAGSGHLSHAVAGGDFLWLQVIQDLLPNRGWGSSPRRQNRLQAGHRMRMNFLLINQCQRHGRDQQNIRGLMFFYSLQSLFGIKSGLGNDCTTYKHAGQ